MKVSSLRPNPKNPRKITDEKLAMLKKALAEFGDLSGVVYNRKTKQLVGGHQRARLVPAKTDVTIEKAYKKPTRTGTVAEGYMLLDGERLAYREVDWDETREKAANIAANKGAGEFDATILSEWLREIDDFGFDLDLTMFDAADREEFMVPTLNPNFQPGDENEQGKLDEKKKVECPECGHEFTT